MQKLKLTGRGPTALPSQGGFTLIEVMVAVIIFALGMLGVAGLQLSSMQATQYSVKAATAMAIAQELSDIMQMTPESVVSSSNPDAVSFFIDTNDTLTAPATTCQDPVNPCTPTQTMQYMQYQWATNAMARNPGGRVVVCKDSTPRVAATGLYKWACDDAGDLVVVKFNWPTKGRTSETFTVSTDPKLAIVLFGNQQDFAP